MPDILREVEQQLTMARPWDVAEPGSFWAITGEYPGRNHSFARCVAMTLPEHVTGSDRPVFVFVGSLGMVNEPVDPAWITHAVPLLLVHRDDPTTPYWTHDREWLRAAVPDPTEEDHDAPA